MPTNAYLLKQLELAGIRHRSMYMQIFVSIRSALAFGPLVSGNNNRTIVGQSLTLNLPGNGIVGFGVVGVGMEVAWLSGPFNRASFIIQIERCVLAARRPMRTIDKAAGPKWGEVHKLNLMAILSIMFVLNFRFCLLACRAANYERSTRQQLCQAIVQI